MSVQSHNFVAAVAHHKAGRTEDAALLYEQTLDLEPDHTGAMFNLASLYAASDRHDDARRCYKRILELQPEDPEALTNLGNLVQTIGNLEEAEGYYNRAIARKPDLALAHLNLGNLYLAKHKGAEAEQSFRTAIELDPFLAQGYTNLGSVLWALDRYDEAEEVLNKAITLDPYNTDALNNLGNVHTERGAYDEALAFYQRAISLNPMWLQPRLNLAACYAKMGQDEEAISTYRICQHRAPQNAIVVKNLAALISGKDADEAETLLKQSAELTPDDPEIYYHFGNLYYARNDNEKAIEAFERAIEINPKQPEFYNNLGNVLELEGRGKDAIAVLRKALELNPKFANAHNNLGNSLLNAGKTEEALEYYHRAIELEDDLIVAANNLGNAYRLLDDNDKAKQWYEETLRLDPKQKAAYNGLGLVLQSANRHTEALEMFAEALKLDPKYPEAWNNKAVSYQETGRYPEAAEAYARVMDETPECPEVYFNLGSLLQFLGRFDQSVTTFYEALRIRPHYPEVYPYLAHALMQQCSWTNLEAMVARVLQNAEEEIRDGREASVQAFGLQSMPGDMELRHGVARQTAKRYERRVSKVKEQLTFDYPKERGEKLKIGYVSPDFRSHSVSLAFHGILNHHDRDRFEYHGYYISSVGHDHVTQYFQQKFDTFQDVSLLSFKDIAETINNQGIHILVDLAGHTRGTRLEIFALQPAPIQAHYVGFSTTTGADFIQYLITDPVQIQPEEAEYCSEKLVHLPETFMPTAKNEVDDAEVRRADFGLPENGAVFANFNSHYKFYPTLFDTWMRILRKTPGSVLWLLAGSETSNANLRKEAKARGVDPERIVFSDRQAHRQHLARMKLADMCFDCLHHGGGVTTTDALFVGVPVLTLEGPTPPSRNGATLAHAIGAPEMITRSFDEYEQLALRLINNPDELKALRNKLLRNAETWPIFDVERLTRHLERAYDMMWDNYAAGNKPTHLQVPALPKKYN